MTDRENDFNRTAQDGEGRQVQQELERQLRELGDTMSDSFRHGFEGRGEEIGDRVWDVGRAAVNAAGYGISEAGLIPEDELIVAEAQAMIEAAIAKL